MKTKIKYKTINKVFVNTIDKIKGSEFIAYAVPVKNEEDVKSELNGIRKKYHDARHHCYAYILGTDEKKIKYSDDGEPSKTAGLPIFTVLNSYDATNILVVVIRYFGGIKLGTGGLVKAYTKATQELLDIVEFSEVEVREEISLSFSYDIMSKVYHAVNLYEGKIIQEEYGNGIVFRVSLNVAFIDEFKEFLIEKTDGKVKFNT